jgi:predicted house-cleaning noncanonical NTP pyrophosphatase (MazG superfamily)
MRRFKIDKLIRKKFLETLSLLGQNFNEKTLNAEAYIPYIKEKLVEESQEVMNSQNATELMEELADVLEVIHAFCNAYGFNFEYIDSLRLCKKEERGGFEDRLYSPYVDIEDNNPMISYYTSEPNKYPELSENKNNTTIDL